ncbi:hypothetical protein BGX26_010343 [Mortierella sp. AD094]|nr:hypothetical protein BGX26_010343 [Mortierella sp. AD094]
MIVIILVINPIRIPLPIPSSKQANSTTTVTTVEGHIKHSSSDTINRDATTTDNTNNSKVQRKTRYPYHLTLNIATAPVIGVLFLLATKSINGETLRDGIVGEPNSGIEPYAVMILFFSLAYICISLDMTGVLQYAAFWISKRGGGGGQRIFFYFFMLSTVMSALTSNDVVILTMTPFLVYFSHAVDLITPVAFLMAEVQTANIASMTLYIGNLTNVVACQAYNISFLEYSAWMILPTIAAIAVCYVMLRINFRKENYIPTVLKSPEVDPRSCLVDPVGAIFGLSILTCSLICLIGTSFAHVSVWTVTGPFALITLCRDIWYDWHGNFKGHQELNLVTTAKDMEVGTGTDVSHSYTAGVESRIEQGLPEIAIPEPSIAHTTQILSSSDGENDEDMMDPAQLSSKSSASSIRERRGDIVNWKESDKDRNDEVSIPLGEVQSTNEKQTKSAASPTQLSVAGSEEMTTAADNGNNNKSGVQRRGIKKHVGRFERRFPLLHAIAIRMPWAILPFTFSMFIMVEGLSDSGWIAIFANWATKVIPNYVVATYAIGFISVLLCNIFNNVPMTILVARILQHPNFLNSPLATPEVQKGCLFALVVGSNLGACTTLISSLAGLMWDSILRSKNSGVGFWQFFRWNMGVMPMVIFVTLSVVVIELATTNIMSSQGYIRIQTNSASIAQLSIMKSSPLKIVRLRNLANTHVNKRSSSDGMTRADVLDTLMPLSRNPWSNIPTLIDNDDESFSIKNIKTKKNDRNASTIYSCESYDH